MQPHENGRWLLGNCLCADTAQEGKCKNRLRIISSKLDHIDDSIRVWPASRLIVLITRNYPTLLLLFNADVKVGIGMTTVEFESCDVVDGLHSDYIVSRFAKACLHLGAFTALVSYSFLSKVTVPGPLC